MFERHGNFEEQAQLLAEEKWIIDTLKKVREQLNCMQIEKLHLRTLLDDYEDSVIKSNFATELTSTEAEVVKPNNSQKSTETFEVGAPHGIRAMGFEFDEATGEELDLAVSQCVFPQDPGYNMEEFEEELDIDTEDENENVFEDMHMLFSE